MCIIQSLSRTLGISRTLTWEPLEAKLPSLASFSMLVLNLEFLNLPALSSSFAGLVLTQPSPEGQSCSKYATDALKPFALSVPAG